MIGAHERKYVRYHFSEGQNVKPEVNNKGLSTKQIIDRQMKIYSKIKDSSEAIENEDGGAIYYGIEVDWVNSWRDFAINGAKMPGRITNQPLVDKI